MPGIFSADESHVSMTLRAPETWAEYLSTKAELCFPVSDDVTDVEAPTLSLTLLLSYDVYRHNQGRNHQGSLSVGKMLMYACLQAEIPLINVVRKPEQVQLAHLHV